MRAAAFAAETENVPADERTPAEQALAMTGTVPVRLVKKTYSHERYDVLVEQIFNRVKHLSKVKGGEYAGDLDRLANFRRNAEALGLNMETIWSVYAAKHWDAIIQYVKDLQGDTTRPRDEPIEGRVNDLIVYLILFRAMIEEQN